MFKRLSHVVPSVGRAKVEDVSLSTAVATIFLKEVTNIAEGRTDLDTLLPSCIVTPVSKLPTCSV